MPEKREKEDEDSELEELLEEEETKKVPQENNKPELEKSTFLEFMSRTDSVSPTLEESVKEVTEVNLENFARESPKEQEDEMRKDAEKNYTSTGDYTTTKDYEVLNIQKDSSIGIPQFERVKDSVHSELGLQDIRNKNDYSAPKDLEFPDSAPPHQQNYKLRKFK